MKPNRAHGSAFSLVELSIVLVILGLLVGGVLSGQSLIRAAQLRSVSTEANNLVTAAQTFRDKYFAVPGDMANATSFWMKDATNCNGHTGTSGTPGTCNGDSNGMVNASAASSTGESQQLWRHLALAGLIEGTYTGIAGAGGAYHCTIGTSCPRSKMSNSGWGAHGLGNYAGDTGYFAGDYGNMLTFGVQTSSEYPSNPALKPEEAWNIDTKMDDGRPGLGKVLAVHYSTCTNASGQADVATTYKLDISTVTCALSFNRSF
jgi:prepilin-type N-terminal cleavage/methylation domain-containing protein